MTSSFSTNKEQIKSFKLDNMIEKKQKVKTIDELLEDTSDITIDTDEPKVEEKVEPKETVVEPEVSEYEKVDQDLTA